MANFRKKSCGTLLTPKIPLIPFCKEQIMLTRVLLDNNKKTTESRCFVFVDPCYIDRSH